MDLEDAELPMKTTFSSERTELGQAKELSKNGLPRWMKSYTNKETLVLAMPDIGIEEPVQA